MRKSILFNLVCMLMVLVACEQAALPTQPEPIIAKREQPVLFRENGLVSDPSVIRYQDELLMVYSDYDLQTDSISFNLVKSDDGINWTPYRSGADTRIFSGNVASWDKLIETPYLMVRNDSVYLYYIGYPDSELINGIYESSIGVAVGVSPDDLIRPQTSPILERGGLRDKDAMTSPSIVEFEGLYYMIYTGWADVLTSDGFLGQTAATSEDGIRWTKTDRNLIPEVQETAFETATETEVIKGPDQQFYLFFSAEGGIALARSESPLGPWDIYPQMLIESEHAWEAGEVVAPTVLIEDGKMRIWYTGVIGLFEGASIGYAEMDFPLVWPD
ncbi:MAG: hypothetical protein AAF206_04780 [Bacteroidota bacterium]